MVGAAAEVKVVIVGSGGRLGAALAREYAGRHAVAGFDRKALDLGSNEAVRAALEPLEFDALINCAAITNVDRCETERAEAMQVNAHAVGEMARICAEKNARMIHISTDYVFDGETEGPLDESSPARPVSVYGESKLAGESELLGVSSEHLAVRVSWIFGPDRPSFVDALLQRALKEDCVSAVADKFSSPTYSLDAAQYLEPLLERGSAGGVLHLCNAGGCSWRDYAQHAIDCAVEAGMPVRARTVEPLRLADMTAFIACRPVHTILATDRLASLLGHPPRPWREAVGEYVRKFLARRS